jgi:hypothetical protein
MMLRRTLPTSLLVAVLPLLGCQAISASITSPSDWISGTGESISGSFNAMSGSLSRSSDSSGGDKPAPDQAYRRDVRVYAAHFARTGGTSQDFLRGIGAVAAEHGISDWESLPATQQAIGEGLRDAGIQPAELDALTAQASDADPAVLALVREGYASAR